MMRILVPLPFLALALSGCAELQAGLGLTPAPTEVAAVVPPPVETLDPTPPPPPPPEARTAEEFDTTSQEERAAAVAPPPVAAEERLGTTIASLGPPANPGIWMETPLVSELTMGRVEYPGAGTSVTLELRPSGGDAGSGSQISLAAMRLLEAPLTGLPELVVFRLNGDPA
jgi:hypothetical protein